MTSKTLIDKFQNLAKELPILYSLQWLAPSNEVLRQALISFSIGSHCGKALYHVFSMDACHLLLGRP